MRKTVLILIFILVGFGLFWAFKDRGREKKEIPPPPLVQEEIKVEDLAKSNPYGVTLTSRFDKKAVILKISQLTADLKTIEYELKYETNEAPRGVLGKIDLKGEESISREITLGTCSKNVCRFDENVKKVTLTLKFIGETETKTFQGGFNL